MLSCLKPLGQESPHCIFNTSFKSRYSYRIVNEKVYGISTAPTCRAYASIWSKSIVWTSEVDENYISAFLHSELMWVLEFGNPSKLLVRVMFNEIYKGETNVKETITKRK